MLLKKGHCKLLLLVGQYLRIAEAMVISSVLIIHDYIFLCHISDKEKGKTVTFETRKCLVFWLEILLKSKEIHVNM